MQCACSHQSPVCWNTAINDIKANLDNVQLKCVQITLAAYLLIEGRNPITNVNKFSNKNSVMVQSECTQCL